MTIELTRWSSSTECEPKRLNFRESSRSLFYEVLGGLIELDFLSSTATQTGKLHELELSAALRGSII